MQAAAEQGPPQMLGAAGIFELPGRTSLEKTLPKKTSVNRWIVIMLSPLVGSLAKNVAKHVLVVLTIAVSCINSATVPATQNHAPAVKTTRREGSIIKFPVPNGINCR